MTVARDLFIELMQKDGYSFEDACLLWTSPIYQVEKQDCAERAKTLLALESAGIPTGLGRKPGVT